jgi:putative CocE/NonD family hydrolase
MNKRRRPVVAKRLWGIAALLAGVAGAVMVTPAVMAAAPAEEVQPAESAYVRQEAMIPMRDGVKLHVDIWRPRNATGPLPILMTRSPYGFTPERITSGLAKTGAYGELAADGFIFVFEDIRGRFGSEGDYVTLRPRKTTPNGIDESTDTYDTIDWLVKSVSGNNGKVGVFGVSYGGWTSAMATIDPHPALKAVSSQASPDDMWLGDDFHHNGAFRFDYAWSWVSALETDGHTMKRFDFGGQPAYDWYLKQHDLATLDQQQLGHSMPYWQQFVQHPDYDGFWKATRTTNLVPTHPTVPDLIVAGWWDQEDFYGPMTIYARQEPGDTDHKNYLVVGPWNHGGWRGEASTYGPYKLGSATGAWFRASVELPWFRYWLKGEGKLDQPEALVFQSGGNQWQRLKSWPPKQGVTTRKLYFHANGGLSFTPPAAGEADADRFISDPANPVPYRDKAVLLPVMAQGSTWPMWIADDQAPFARRKDVLSWRTAVLDHDVTLSGAVVAKLFASTTGSDADWVVKLIDVYPDDAATPAELRGRQRMIANDVFRGRYRKSFEKPEPLSHGVLDYAIDLHSASHVFQKGHRIAVQVQSSWFPLIDRNPQTWVPNILTAKPGDFAAQTHAIYHSTRYPSAIEVSIADPAG